MTTLCLIGKVRRGMDLHPHPSPLPSRERGFLAFGGTGHVETGGLDEESQAHQEIVVTVRGIDKEIKRTVGTVNGF